jgi:hypothetical protein
MKIGGENVNLIPLAQGPYSDTCASCECDSH